MKKILVLLMIISIALSSTSCGNTERVNPRGSTSELSSEDKVLGKEALKVIDNALDGKLGYEKAAKELDNIINKFSNKDSVIETSISICLYAVEDFYEEESKLSQEKLERNLLLQRNDLADDIDENYRDIIIKDDPIEVNLKELATNSEVYNMEFVKTTINVSKKNRTTSYWVYNFEVLGLGAEYSSVSFYTNGYSFSSPDSDLITVTGIVDCLNYDNNILIDIYAINEKAVAPETDETLFTDLNKVSAGYFFKNKSKNKYDSYYDSYYDNYYDNYYD